MQHRKLQRESACILLCALLLVPCPVAAYAAEEGTLIGLTPGSYKLFEPVSALWPGQSVTHTITLKNESRTYSTFFLEAQSATAADFDSTEDYKRSELLLEQIQVKIVVYGINRRYDRHIPQTLYEGPASQTANGHYTGLVGQSIELTTLYPGETTQIVVDIDVPEELDNSYEFWEGKFWWIFSCQSRNEPFSSDSRSGRHGREEDLDCSLPEQSLPHAAPVEEWEPSPKPIGDSPKMGGGDWWRCSILLAVGSAFCILWLHKRK